MSQAKAFRHQDYTNRPPISPHYLVNPQPCLSVESDEFRQRMQRVGDVFREAGVEAIYLVHGTFVGPDALGILAELARVFPSAGKAVQRVIKRIVDKVAGEVGNYTPAFARRFESSLCGQGNQRIPVKLFNWSSENHHLGRADGAVRLIDELASQPLTPGKRVLLFGHSHAGNVFALMTNLLSGNREATERFFEAAEIYYRWPVVGVVDIPVWYRVRDLLRKEPMPLSETSLDIVTFGTPIRYGWNPDGYAKLLHFINHRPTEGLPEYRAPFPPKVNDILSAEGGDYVQQLGIAGTNVMPSVFAWREWMADNRLNRLLQNESPKIGGPECFRAGTIVPDEGTSLLVDYGLPQGGIGEHLAGHAVYTRSNWLLFHAEEIARRLYDAELKAA